MIHCTASCNLILHMKIKSSISWSKPTSATITILDYTYGKLLLWFNHVSNLQSVLLYIPDWKHASMESFMSKHPLGCIEKLATASVTSHLDFESLVLEFGQCHGGYLKPRAISQMYTCGPSLIIFHWTGWGGSTWGPTCEGTCYSQYWSKGKLVLILHKMRVTTTKWIHCQAVWGCQPSWTAAPSTCLWPVDLPVWTGLHSGLLDWIPNAALHQPHAR